MRLIRGRAVCSTAVRSQNGWSAPGPPSVVTKLEFDFQVVAFTNVSSFQLGFADINRLLTALQRCPLGCQCGW